MQTALRIAFIQHAPKNICLRVKAVGKYLPVSVMCRISKTLERCFCDLYSLRDILLW
jgi:hypothetical protein